MKKIVVSCFVASLFLLLVCSTLARAIAADGYQTGTVTSVTQQDDPSSFAGENPTDAPLRARIYTYEVQISLNCNLYVGRYQSEIKYLPSVFAPNHKVDVRLHKHIIYVSLPFNDEDMMMGIIRHRRLKSGICAQATNGKTPVSHDLQPKLKGGTV